MKSDHQIVGIHIDDRLQEAVEVQKVLTEFGKYIKTRLGLHDLESGDAPNGLLLVEMVAEADTVADFANKLTAIHGVEAQTMTFSHPA